MAGSLLKTMLGGAAAAGLALLAVQAAGGSAVTGGPVTTAAPAERTMGWGEWRSAFGVALRPARSADAVAPEAGDAADELDVVDAHWMALTMWGEARGDGEAGMRAVGHVIDNRRRTGAPGRGFVTDTVSEAWQFSCWNAGDPNHRAILEIDRLPAQSHDRRMWRRARQLADEILAGRSRDPTGGALFYHTEAVAPAWSQGVPVASRIGRHLFFRTAR